MGPHSPTGSELSAPSASLRRLGSAGLLGALGELTAEPEDLRGHGHGHGLHYGTRDHAHGDMGLGGLIEEEDEDEDEEDGGEFEDYELPEWARRDRFGDNLIGE